MIVGTHLIELKRYTNVGISMMVIVSKVRSWNNRSWDESEGGEADNWLENNFCFALAEFFFHTIYDFLKFLFYHFRCFCD